MSSDSVRRLGSKNMVESDCNRHGASRLLPHSGAHPVHRVCSPSSLSLYSPLPFLLPFSFFSLFPLFSPSSSHPTVKNNCPHLPGWLEGLKPRSSEKCLHRQCCFPLSVVIIECTRGTRSLILPEPYWWLFFFPLGT